MASIGRSALKVVAACSRNITVGPKILNASTTTPLRNLNRSFAFLSSSATTNFNKDITKTCSCGCGIQGIHTKGDREIVEFLQGEISAEKKHQISAATELPNSIDDFSVTFNRTEVTMTKKFNDEEITIIADVNHSIEEEQGVEEGEEASPIKCTPNFEVEVKIGSKTMLFKMAYMPPAESEEPSEPFGMSEVSIYDGEWKENVYAVAGDLLDETLYDLFLNYLHERGITAEFTEKLSYMCTDYEHNLYILMLEDFHKTIKRT